jgi:ribA/ribD-fused uncharacterized protein
MMKEKFIELSTEEREKLTSEEREVYLLKRREYLNSLENERWHNLPYESKLDKEREHAYEMVEYHSVLSPSLNALLTEKLENLSIEEITITFGAPVANMIKCLRNYQNPNEEFIYFWETKSVFSQWHLCEFEGATFWLYPESDTKRKDIINDNFPLTIQKYSSTEQFMMYHKAMLFFDIECAKKIMATNDVRKIKAYGREVKFFNSKVWDYYKVEIVYAANKAKFTQNTTFREILIATNGKTIVEASPNDSIWGIGLSKDDILSSKRNTWKGHNLLGEVLTLLRIEVNGHY